MTSLHELNTHILRAVGFTDEDMHKLTGDLTIRLNRDSIPIIECTMYPKPIRELSADDIIVDAETGERELPLEDLKFKLVPIEDDESVTR